MNTILKILAGNTRALKYIGVFIFVAGVIISFKHTYYVYHTKVINDLKLSVWSLKQDVNSTEAKLKLCENKNKIDVFEAVNIDEAESIEEIINNMRGKDEKHDLNSSVSNDGWLF